MVPLIPPLLVNNDFLTDFLVKQTCLITFSENNVDLTQKAALFRTTRSLKLQLDFQTLTLTLVLLLNFVHLVMAVMAQNLFTFFFNNSVMNDCFPHESKCYARLKEDDK